ncbi:hypothetical protein NE237_009134 [Protea cynaroides]|uniref:DCD domain-containing protein n=1 Tax=Protea cynaroides TaxID=273540 RepID=A0A9Q0KY01_9MAGN|nr:hypothetical protein NE237_009134 [Protea cynaroides]
MGVILVRNFNAGVVSQSNGPTEMRTITISRRRTWFLNSHYLPEESNQLWIMALKGNKKKVGPAAEAEASSGLSSSKTGNPKSLKPKRKIVKKSSNQNSSNAKESTAAQIQGKPNHEKKNTHEGIKQKNAINQTKDDKKKNSQELNKEKSFINENSQRDQKGKEELGGLIFMCNGKTKPDCFRYGVMGVPLSQKELVMGIKPGLKLFLYDFDLKLLYGIYKSSSAGGMKLEPAAFDGAFPVQVRFKVHKDCFPLPESVFKRAIQDNYDEKKHKFETELTVLQVKRLINLFQTTPSVQSNAHFVQAPPQPQLLQAPLQPQLRALPMPTLPAREVSEVRKELTHQATRETFLSDPYSLDGGRVYFLQSDHENGQLSREPAVTYREVATPQEKAIHLDPLFLTEKEYRTYGLPRERHSLTPSASVDRSAFMGDLYQKDREREQLPRHAGSRHRETASTETDQVRRDPLFLSEKDYRAFGLGQEQPSLNPHAAVANGASTINTYAKDPYYPHRYDSSTDAYPMVPRREASSLEPYPLVPRSEPFLTKSDYQERGSTDFSRSGAGEVGGPYPRYAFDALSDYNKKHDHLEGRHELASASVSSRYSFMGPSVTYR